MGATKRGDFGTKLLNELMVDIIGALIPGFLFIIVVVISVVIPCLIYCEASYTKRLAEFANGSFWWVFLILCVIFSYVIGHIFYREDIAIPDQINVDRQIKKFVNSVKKNNYNRENLKSLLKREVEILHNRLIQDKRVNFKFKYILTSACKKVIENLSNDNIPRDHNDENFLTVLFPEDVLLMKNGIAYADLSQSSINVITEYENYFDISDGDVDPELRCLLIFYCILHCQMDIGCETSKRCEFPYINYYKYLIRRDMCNLLEYVNWATVEDRTKNKINSLKIKISVFVNEAYALINKNESHIRMSSSTWHITKLLMFVTMISFLVFFIIAIVHLFSQFGAIMTIQYLAFLLPLTIFLLIAYIHNCITKYIHYQRMREIQYTLQIYDQVKEIIKFRRNNYAINKGEYTSSEIK